MKLNKWLIRAIPIVLIFSMMIGTTGCSLYDTVESDSMIETNEVIKGTEGKKTDATTSTITIEGPSTTIKSDGNNAASDIKISDKSTSIEEGLDFKGKTFTIAMESGIADPAGQRLVAAFNKKFNCNLKMEYVTGYTTSVANRLASGDPFDVCYMGTYRFPTEPIAGLYEPLNDLIYTADLEDKNNLSKGGFSMERSSNFVWNGNIYGVIGSQGWHSASPVVIFYNKKMISEAGAEDPRTLYEQGKWTWDKFKQIGKAVTNASQNIYMANAKIYLRYFVGTNGATYVKWENGKPIEDLTNTKLINAFQLLQSMSTGANQIIDKSSTWDAGPFIKGNIATWAGGEYEYYNNNQIAKNVMTSNAFGKSIDNLGIVPYPNGPDNDNNCYPYDDINVFCAGSGTSDKRVAVALAKFASYYKDPVENEYPMNSADQKLINQLLQRTPLIHNYRGFSSSTTRISDLIQKMESAIGLGNDISKTLNDYKSSVSNCIKATMGN